MAAYLLLVQHLGCTLVSWAAPLQTWAAHRLPLWAAGQRQHWQWWDTNGNGNGAAAVSSGIGQQWQRTTLPVARAAVLEVHQHQHWQQWRNRKLRGQ